MLNVPKTAMIFLQMQEIYFAMVSMYEDDSLVFQSLLKVSHQDRPFAFLHIQIGWSPY